MKTIVHNFNSNKKNYTIDLALPESLTEAVELMGERDVYILFKEAYIRFSERMHLIEEDPDRKINIRLKDLDPDMIKSLQVRGLI